MTGTTSRKPTTDTETESETDGPSVAAAKPSTIPDNTVIRASAGTGKTWQLSNRYLKRLNEGAGPDRILAVTFTRAAAGEILERILQRLAQAAINSAACAQLAEQFEDTALDCARCLELLTGLTRQLHRFRIGTLDSFFVHLAGSFSLELGLTPGWTIADDRQLTELRLQAIDRLLGQQDARDATRLMHLLTKGETSRSVAALIDDTVTSLYRVFLDSAPEAWTNFRSPGRMTDEAIERLLEDLTKVPVRGKSIPKVLQSDIAKIRAGDWESFVGVGIAAKVLAGEETYSRQPIEPDLRDIYEKLLAHACAAIVETIAAQTRGTFELLQRYHEVSGQVKVNRGVVEFGDITRVLSARDTIRDVRSVSYRLDAHVDHMLLDEFQDTSLGQWNVLHPLAQAITETRIDSGGPARSFFCVGDVKQAIYGWRGGQADIFDAIESQLQGLRQESLEHSFRSSQPIIDTVNQVFQNLHRHPTLEGLAQPVVDWSRRFKPHTTARTELAGYAQLQAAALPDDNESDRDALLNFAADQIATLARQHPERTIGVLTRTNPVIGRLIQLLRFRGIQASEEGGNAPTDSAAGEVLMSLVQFADHPGDSAARFHVANSPLGPNVGLPPNHGLRDAELVARRLRRRLVDEGYGPCLLEWSVAIGDHCRSRDRRRMQAIVKLAFEYDARATLRPADFAQFVRDSRVADPTSDPVRIMTIHRSKGLQFDIVVLPETNWWLTERQPKCAWDSPDPTQPIDRVCRWVRKELVPALPAQLQTVFDAKRRRDVTEALCLLYVALTRAVHALHIIVPAPGASEKHIPKTGAGLLRAALTQTGAIEPNEIAFRIGNPDWDPEPADSPSADVPRVESRSTPDASPRPVKLAPMPDGRRRGLRILPPSSQEGRRMMPLGHVLRSGNRNALDYGVIIHRWFEEISWIDDGRPDDSTLRSVLDAELLARNDIAPLIAGFDDMLIHPEIQSLLSRSRYFDKSTATKPSSNRRIFARLPSDCVITIHNERRFVIRDGNTIVPGSIDRLVVFRKDNQPIAAEIIDYKTDRVTATDKRELKQRRDHYAGQIIAYRAAVARMLNISDSEIAASLAMVTAGIVLEL